MVSLLSKSIEVDKTLQPNDQSETSSVSHNGENKFDDKKASIFSKMPRFSRKSKINVIKLCILLALDSFACSLAPL